MLQASDSSFKKMLSTEFNQSPKNGIDDRNTIIEEYEAIVESLQQELNNCKAEQIQLRIEVEALKDENKKVDKVAREAFSNANCLGCTGRQENNESVDTLKKQIAIIQLEKESMYQLWQMSLKAVNTLEEEIKISNNDEKAIEYYNKQVNCVKETYSEAIKALEVKLIQAKENFTKHQAIWESSREKINSLNCEKNSLEKKIEYLENEMVKKDESNQKIIDVLKSDFDKTLRELESFKNLFPKLENDLFEARNLATKMIAKDQESKNKVAEAIELIETAMKEKEIVLQREARIMEEKSKLESNLENLAENFAGKLEQELLKAKKDNHDETKKYILEIKELKAELREKSIFLDRTQRECRMAEEELEKIRHGNEDFNQRSGAKVIELEEKLKESNYQLENCKEACQRKFQDIIRQSDNQIAELEEKLKRANDSLKWNQSHITREMEDRLREADERVNEAVNKYSGLEKRLIRALDERENFSSELRSLQITFDREISRREGERRLLESRIRELQEDLKKSNNVADQSAIRANILASQVESFEKEIRENKKYAMIRNEDIQATDAERLLNFKKMQEKYEERISELTKHVQTHQKLSNKWKEEAESIAEQFQTRYKELRTKANNLQRNNEELNKELLSCRQQVASCRAQIMQRCDQYDDTR